MRKTFILIIGLILAGQTAIPYTQSDIDSFEIKLKTATCNNKTIILNNLTQLYWAISPKKGIEYGELALKLARE